MRLSQRLLLGFLFVITVLSTLVVLRVDRSARNRLRLEAERSLAREVLLVGTSWRPEDDADSLADVIGSALDRRVTLINTAGVVVGDTEFDAPRLGDLENHLNRPEVAAAMRDGAGVGSRRSSSTGDDEIYAAARTPLGVARVSLKSAVPAAIVNQLLRDVLSAALLASIVALALSVFLARSVSRPVAELTADARAIAAGDLTRRPSLSAPGEVGALASAFHRLAEQLAARVAALEADDALLRGVTESLNEGVFAVDARQQVLHLNQRARDLLGVDDELPFAADLLPRDRVLRDCLAAAQAGEPIDAVETTLLDRVVALTARPLANGGAVLALYDVTPIRRLETVRRDFVANVSHELKTPLTIVGGFAETLQDEDVPPEQRRQFAAAVLTNTRRMHRLVDDLLDLSRIESGGWLPKPVSVDNSAVAAAVFASVAKQALHNNVALRDEVSPDAATIHSDPLAFRQIIANLVDNAIRHSAAGTVTVFSEPAAAGVSVGVRDTGSGIAAEHLGRVFERFYRVDAARARQQGGTGLGLAIVKHLVEAHGGRVSAESVLGAGTTFRATFVRGA